ncbi:alpha/beta fold hydrolase [Aeromicrobium terrae]|uniref:Alpha/beta fold hydrolase n=1 Tax=Aeromicrobium terrae TaxID=2498846 RepID=A0A5C8NKF7_9ACTN|nr:alpha/beta fold hydrolase [Aeromicrobium terrae]
MRSRVEYPPDRPSTSATRRLRRVSAAIHSTQIGESGARVVFLHGLFGQGKNFTRVAKALQPEATSLLVDLPNHGRSAWTQRADYRDMAADVAEHLERGFAADGPVHVIGHSMGGKVAMVLALTRPELVDRLVVADIAPEPNGGSGEFEHLLSSLASIDVKTLKRRSDADEQLREKIPDDTVRGFLLQNLRSAPDGYEWQANLDVLRRDLPTIGDFPFVDATFDHPVLWVAGEHSDYIQDRHAERMRSYFPRTRLVTIKGAGHWVHSEQPEAFVSALRVFLEL